MKDRHGDALALRIEDVQTAGDQLQVQVHAGRQVARLLRQEAGGQRQRIVREGGVHVHQCLGAQELDLADRRPQHGAAATELLVLDSPREMARFSLSEVIPTLVKKIPQVAVNPAEPNSSQNMSEEPATMGPHPAPPPETPAEGKEEVPEPAGPVSDAV